MRLIFSFLLLLCFSSYAQNRFPDIGQWREHLPYQSAIDVTASDTKLYCATPYSLFSVDLGTKELERISKVSGLSETGISTILYDGITKKLLVAYTNSNIDLLDNKGVHTIPDLKRQTSSGDKTIYQVYASNERFYLSTGLGIVVIDPEKEEISDSWIIGNSGGPIRTHAFTQNNNLFYAATDEGLKSVPATDANLADFRRWKLESGQNGLSLSPCLSVVSLQGRTIALQNDSLFMDNSGHWDLFFANGWPVVSISASEGQLIVCQRRTTGESQVVVLAANGTVASSLQKPGVISFPRKGIAVQQEYWIADQYGGLSEWNGSSFLDVYLPNSPADVALGPITAYHGVVYAAAGTVNDAWNYQYNRNGLFQLKEGNWTSYNQYGYPQLDSVMDIVAMTVDPRDGSIWAGSFGGGLEHIKTDHTIEIFKQNSPIEPAVGDPTSYRVSGLAFDAGNNLWVSNFGSPQPLHVLKADGSWQSFATPFSLFQNAAAQILVDDFDQEWIVSPLDNGLMVFNHGADLANTADDRWQLYRGTAAQGNLPSSTVLCLAKDKNGYIWVGTSDGIGVIQCPNEVFGGGCPAIWPIIKEGGFANYLFKGQVVRSIAVDGADRKWVATSNGAWLINAEGDQVLAHFTEDNSPLASNDVRSIAVNGQTGEVFLATINGIQSFRGSATEATETAGKVLVFPNPVPPGYGGTIGIRGLPENSIVKITETNGRLVYQTRALGGQATWNGKDYTGRSVSSGVYLVLAEDENKQEKVVTKVVFVSR